VVKGPGNVSGLRYRKRFDAVKRCRIARCY